MIKVQERSEIVSPQGENLPTACVLCTHSCGLRVDVVDNKIVEVRGDETSPFSHGYSCNKGYSIGHYADHQQRVKTPLKRMAEGKYIPISWDQAISEISNELKKIRATHGVNSVGLTGVGGQANYLDGFYALPFLGLLGSKQYFSAYAQEKTQHHWVDQLMINADVSNTFHADAWHCDYLIVIGTNPVISNRGENATDCFKALKKDPNRQFVVIDPRRTETARKADTHIQHRPGTDAYLLMAIIKFIMQESWQDKSFVKQNTHGYKELEQLFYGADVDVMASICEVSSEQIIEVAKKFASAEKAAIMADLGTEHIMHSTLVSWLVRVLSAITGNYAVKGGNVFPSQFAADWGPLIDKEKIYSPVSNYEGIVAHQPFAMFSPYLVPEEIEAGNLKAMIVEGSNPLVSFGDSKRYKKAFESLALTVVIDPAMTETARCADYVLPTPVGYEKWEWSVVPKGHPEIYGHLRQPVVQGPEQALPEAEIYTRLASALGLIKEPPFLLRWLGRRAKSKKGFYSILLLLVAALRAKGDRKSLFGHSTFLNYQALSQKGSEAIPSPAVAALWMATLIFVLTRRQDVLRVVGKSFRWMSPIKLAQQTFNKILDNPNGVELARIDENNLFDLAVRTKNRKIHLLPPEIFPIFNQAIVNQRITSEEFPLLFCAGARTQWTANNVHRSPQWRKGRGPHFFIQMNATRAKKMGIASGDNIRVRTAQGSVQGPAVLDENIHRDMVLSPNGFGASYPNSETGELEMAGQNLGVVVSMDLRDPITAVPYVKNQPCVVEKVEQPIQAVEDDCKSVAV